MKPDSPIKTVKDFKGKKIGYTNPRRRRGRRARRRRSSAPAPGSARGDRGPRRRPATRARARGRRRSRVRARGPRCRPAPLGTSSPVSGWKAMRWQRERTVASSAPGLAVRRMSRAWPGGSSSVFSSAFCTTSGMVSASQIRYTRRSAENGRSWMSRHSSRTWSMRICVPSGRTSSRSGWPLSSERSGRPASAQAKRRARSATRPRGQTGRRGPDGAARRAAARRAAADQGLERLRQLQRSPTRARDSAESPCRRRHQAPSPPARRRRPRSRCGLSGSRSTRSSLGSRRGLLALTASKHAASAGRRCRRRRRACTGLGPDATTPW